MQAWTPPEALQGGREDGENDCRQLDSLVVNVLLSTETQEVLT